MDFIAKKYQILLGNEPITLWIKNNEIQQAKFMDKRIQLQLDAEAIRQIKDQPSKIVNGNALMESESFTKSVSQMMSSQLDLAIAKNDKKVLSRFARSSLVPEQDKDRFIEAINRPNGLRGVLVRAVNKTNAIFQNLAKKIDRFFDKINDRVANQKLDKYLSEYQLSEFNKAPPINSQDLSSHVDPKLMRMAEKFYKDRGFEKEWFGFEPNIFIKHKVALNDFLKEGVSQGFSLKDTKLALYKVKHEVIQTNHIHSLSNANENLLRQNHELKKRLAVFEQKEASKNETLKDFEVLSKDMPQADRIDVLVKNTEYKNLSESEKQKVEDRHIFNPEPILQRAEELQNIVEVVQSVKPMYETVIDRTPSVDFLSALTKKQIDKVWSEQQVKNRENAEPTRDFMNISAVRFNGVSKDALEKWASAAKSNSKTDAATIDKFVAASLRNAEELVKVGVMLSPEPGIFTFVDNLAKEALYKGFDKTVAEISNLNQGKEITREVAPDLKRRLESITSPESFQKLVIQNGKIDVVALQEYTDKIVSLSTAIHNENKANVVTIDDLRKADQSISKSKEQQKAGGIER